MRSIYSLLAEIESCEMELEFTEELSSLQDILCTFNDHVKPFKNIQMIPENERYVSELRQRIVYFLTRQGFWDTATDSPSSKQAHQKTLRMIALFLLYNADTDANEIVESGQNVCHLVGNCPRLTKCVFFYLVTKLKLFPYFCEFLQYGRSDLVVQFLDSELLNSIKLIETDQRLEILALIISGIYHHCFVAAFLPCEDKDAREDHFEKIRDFLATLLLSHAHADREKFPELKKQLEFDTYVGNLLRFTLRAIIECLESFLKKAIDTPLNRRDFGLFQTHPGRELGDYRPDEFLLNYLTSLNSLALNRVQMVLMTVSCNTFMNWVEVDLSKTVTLQRAVGELAHHLMGILAANEALTHDIQSVLKEIAVKPLTLEEIAKEANISEIIRHIEDKADRNRSVWMGHFIERGLIVLDNEECLAVIAEHCKLLSVDELKKLVIFLKDNVEADLSYLPQIVEIMVSVLCSFERADQVEEFLETEEPFRVLMDYDLSTETYFESLTEFLNKLVDLNEDTLSVQNLSPFVTALMIDPCKTIAEVQNNAITDTNLVANGLRVLGVLKGFVCGFMDDIVKELLETRVSEAGALKGLEMYIVGLVSNDFVDKKEFLKTTLFQELVKSAQDKAKSVETLTMLSIWKGVLHSEGKVELSPDLRAPLIVALGEVADTHRWDLIGYSSTMEKIVSLATGLIGDVGARGPPLEGKHKAFILHKAQSLKELNRFYVEKLFPENEETSFVRYLHPATFQTDKNRRDFLCKIFVRATPGEKEWLAECQELQKHFLGMMLTITKAASGHEKLFVGYRGAFSGFLKIFKEKLLDALPFDDVCRFIDLVAVLPVDIYTVQSFIVNGVVEKIMEQAEQEEEGKKKELQKKIREFPPSSAKTHLLELLLKE